jgi:hypothetical protein
VIRSSLRLLLAAIALAACQGGPTIAPAQTPDIASPVDGIVLSVDSAGLGDVRGFTLRPNGSGTGFGFVLGDLENATEFSPSHLAEHQASSSPVRVYFRVDGDERVVYRLEDAPGPEGS